MDHNRKQITQILAPVETIERGSSSIRTGCHQERWKWEKLTNQIEEDSEPSDDEGYDSSNGEHQQLSNLTLCVALKMNDQFPRTWKQAINESIWFTAMKNEINEFQEKGAWELVERTNNIKFLLGVWTYRVKKNEKGEVVKYKAKWCVNGSHDKFRWPNEATFSRHRNIRR